MYLKPLDTTHVMFYGNVRRNATRAEYYGEFSYHCFKIKGCNLYQTLQSMHVLLMHA
jgi:hypothetical protein